MNTAVHVALTFVHIHVLVLSPPANMYRMMIAWLMKHNLPVRVVVHVAPNASDSTLC
eukprot:COSAG05_NODE_379_length_10567_cov_18.553687_10_plen_57_part_00